MASVVHPFCDFCGADTSHFQHRPVGGFCGDCRFRDKVYGHPAADWFLQQGDIPERWTDNLERWRKRDRGKEVYSFGWQLWRARATALLAEELSRPKRRYATRRILVTLSDDRGLFRIYLRHLRMWAWLHGEKEPLRQDCRALQTLGCVEASVARTLCEQAGCLYMPRGHRKHREASHRTIAAAFRGVVRALREAASPAFDEVVIRATTKRRIYRLPTTVPGSRSKKEKPPAEAGG
jgi:hypothetical protein